jgi:multicomponent Na+:H+ antiporter subunit C
MKLAFALAASILFGTGAYLLLNRDLVRVVLGVVIISQAATLTLIASGLTRGIAPIYPLTGRDVSDPLSQAMALTAIVIGLAVTALLGVLVLRTVVAFRSRELDEVADEEAEREARLERRTARAHEDEEEATAR